MQRVITLRSEKAVQDLQANPAQYILSFLSINLHFQAPQPACTRKVNESGMCSQKEGKHIWTRGSCLPVVRS